MKVTNYTDVRLNLRATLDEVHNTNVPTLVTSKNSVQVVIVPKKMYDDFISYIANMVGSIK